MVIQTGILDELATIPWFLDLTKRQLEALASISSIIEVKAGQVIFNDGDQLDHMYIILEGEVGVDFVVPAHGQVRIYTAQPLDIIGWSKMTPVVRQRVASTTALKNTRLLLIQGDELLSICDQDRQVGYIIFKRLANVVASNLLMTKLQLLDRILHPSQQLV